MAYINVTVSQIILLAVSAVYFVYEDLQLVIMMTIIIDVDGPRLCL
jgi:hypothetical protein